jgi:V8-like Glu-specific endopeptidase
MMFKNWTDVPRLVYKGGNTSETVLKTIRSCLHPIQLFLGGNLDGAAKARRVPMRLIAKFASLGLFLSGTANALAFPETPLMPAAPLLAGEMDLANYDFEGIVELSNCSGSLVRFHDSKDSDQALVLTNGHCVGMLDPGLVIVNQAANKTFNLLRRDASKAGKLRATRLVFATMTKTDIGLYQVKETYDFIRQKFSIAPLTLTDEAPAMGTDIQILSGYWKRGYECKIEAEVFKLQEGDWTMERSLRFSRPGCETIGGTSGSPVIATGSRTVVAVNNTGNDGGRKCTVNNPCEVDENGSITAAKGLAYSQQIYWLAHCRTAEGVFDLNVDGCELPKPSR